MRLLASSAEPIKVGSFGVKSSLWNRTRCDNLTSCVMVIVTEHHFTAIILIDTISGNLDFGYFVTVPRINVSYVELFSSHNVDPFKIVLCFEVNC